ncbi:MAG: hypothetical protein IID40_01265 [Planctomycetes bacterium]|nr:hypothetical protein [Planctomycetota bacterium]
MAEHRVVVCPNCMQKYRVPAERMGSRAVCKTCGERFKIASPEPLDDDTVFGWITGDDPSGTAPRVGAPTWTGTRLGQFRTLSGSMADALDGATLDVMIELMVRDLSQVLGNV